MMDAEDHVKIIDFGLGKDRWSVEPGMPLPHEGRVGKTSYMPPEIFAGRVRGRTGCLVHASSFSSPLSLFPSLFFFPSAPTPHHPNTLTH